MLLRRAAPCPVRGLGGRYRAGAEEHLRALAELLPARVATTPRAKGLFPEDHELSLGILGVAGHADAREALLGENIDLVLTIGASLNETSTLNWHPGLRAGKTFIQLDIDADRIGRNYPVDLPLVGDAQTILVELVYHAHRGIREGATPESTWTQPTPRHAAHARYDDPGGAASSDAVPLTPQRWRCDLEEVLPENAVVFSDIGGHMLFNIHHLCIKPKQQFVINLGFGSMGHGTVAAIGAAMAAPGRPVFALVGDGCFAMNGMELITAAEHDVSVIWIVENNNMHGITHHASKQLGRRGQPLGAAKYRKAARRGRDRAKAMGLSTWVVDAPGSDPGRRARGARPRADRASSRSVIDAERPPPIGDRARSPRRVSSERTAR